MRKKSFHSITVIFLIAGIASCKKEENAPVIPPPVYQPPVARAGNDTTYTLSSCGAIISVPLDGTKSSDPENIIKHASWRVISGAPDLSFMYAFNSLNVIASIRRAGVYYFELQIENGHNLTSKDTVKITIIGSSPKEYDLDITSKTAYIFRDNYANCNDGGLIESPPCPYYDETEILGTGTFAPIGLLNIGLKEFSDTARVSFGATSEFSVYDANYTTTVYGSTAINFKKIIQQGGGAFTGNFTVTGGSAINCDANIYNNLAPLALTGNLDTTTKKVSIRIKGKVFF